MGARRLACSWPSAGVSLRSILAKSGNPATGIPNQAPAFKIWAQGACVETMGQALGSPRDEEIVQACGNANRRSPLHSDEGVQDPRLLALLRAGAAGRECDRHWRNVLDYGRHDAADVRRVPRVPSMCGVTEQSVMENPEYRWKAAMLTPRHPALSSAAAVTTTKGRPSAGRWHSLTCNEMKLQSRTDTFGRPMRSRVKKQQGDRGQAVPLSPASQDPRHGRLARGRRRLDGGHFGDVRRWTRDRSTQGYLLDWDPLGSRSLSEFQRPPAVRRVTAAEPNVRHPAVHGRVPASSGPVAHSA